MAGKNPPEWVRIAINGRLTRTHRILFFNSLSFANEHAENSCRLKILSFIGLDKSYCATLFQKLQALKSIIFTIYSGELASIPQHLV